MLAATLSASLLRKMLARKRVIRTSKSGNKHSWSGVLMPPHLFWDINILYQIKPIFNGVYSRNNLPKIKDEAYVINLDKYKSTGTHWIVLSMNGDNGKASNNATYFNNFGVKDISKQITFSKQIWNEWQNAIKIFSINFKICKMKKICCIWFW